MISELLFISLLAYNVSAQTLSVGEIVAENVLIESNGSFDTFLTPRGTYLTCFKDCGNLDRSSSTDSYNSQYIQNKYYVDGFSTTYNTNPLIVGKSMIINPSGGNADYKTVFGLNLSAFPRPSSIINAGLVVDKSSGSLNSVYAYRVTSNIPFSQINGTASFSKSYITLCSASNGSFNFVLTDEVVDFLEHIQNNNYVLNVILEGHENYKTCDLYSVSNSSHCPRLYVEYTLYGSAPSYSFISTLTSANCLGLVELVNYAVDIDSNLQNALGMTPVNSYVMQTTVLNVVKNEFGTNHTRLIQSYNSYISPSERRIAVRLKLSANNYHYAGDYHFVCQCSDGSWGGKFGTGPIYNYAGDDAPETDNTIWYQYNSYYVNSDILYFAYSGN